MVGQGRGRGRGRGGQGRGRGSSRGRGSGGSGSRCAILLCILLQCMFHVVRRMRKWIVERYVMGVLVPMDVTADGPLTVWAYTGVPWMAF